MYDDDEEPPDDDYAVWPDCAEALSVFLALRTQWQVGIGMGGAIIVGLRYEALPVVLTGMGLTLTPELFADLQEMESAALPILNKHD